MIKHLSFVFGVREYIVLIKKDKYRILYHRSLSKSPGGYQWIRSDFAQPVQIPKSHQSSTTNFNVMLEYMKGWGPKVRDLTLEELLKYEDLFVDSL